VASCGLQWGILGLFGNHRSGEYRVSTGSQQCNCRSSLLVFSIRSSSRVPFGVGRETELHRCVESKTCGGRIGHENPQLNLSRSKQKAQHRHSSSFGGRLQCLNRIVPHGVEHSEKNPIAGAHGAEVELIADEFVDLALPDGGVGVGGLKGKR